MMHRSVWNILRLEYIRLFGCALMIFTKFGKFSGHHVFKNSSHFCVLSSLQLPLFVCWFTWWCLTGLWGSPLLFILLLILFLRVRSLQLTCLQVFWFFLLPIQILCWTSLMNFFILVIIIFNSRFALSFLWYFFTDILFGETSPSYF